MADRLPGDRGGGAGGRTRDHGPAQQESVAASGQWDTAPSSQERLDAPPAGREAGHGGGASWYHDDADGPDQQRPPRRRPGGGRVPAGPAPGPDAAGVRRRGAPRPRNPRGGPPAP